ncbi:DUF202 domain-containing protein [Corynebacterium aquatimens]|uniref:Uncharacterized membrane protein YidH (DUF202 family) n=1 Tax=Corynebacterium aquatimens TaxID=1190508 RepID=A0A931E2K3_9CORY|nr:DUF202 domain-containing protein [Corynebacterium aquatimens]MBG6122767.1 uncharacterized membrane protein YidH (DUF202 family) [Corynebacterium aquatimens]WJY66898.1 hypothetical protein CAQUA_11075 [Corynebacterium aquatimens]
MIQVADEGLQPERTAMSWTRTAAAMMVCSLTLLRWSQPYPTVVFGAIGLLAVVAGVIGLRERAMYRRQAEGLAHERVAANARGVLGMSAAMLVLGAIGMFLVLSV